MDLMQVIDQIGREKGIEKGILIDAVGAAILSASRKSLPAAQAALDLRVDFDGKSGQFMLYAVRKVVEAPINPKIEIVGVQTERYPAAYRQYHRMTVEVPGHAFDAYVQPRPRPVQTPTDGIPDQIREESAEENQRHQYAQIQETPVGQECDAEKYGIALQKQQDEHDHISQDLMASNAMEYQGLRQVGLHIMGVSRCSAA